MAPEMIIMDYVEKFKQLFKENAVGYNQLCDVWSIGCIAYNIVTDGELPFYPDEMVKA
jgi:hypothetical protein